MTEKFYPYKVICPPNAKGVKDVYGCDDLADARRTAKKHGGVIREQVGARNPASHDSVRQIRAQSAPVSPKLANTAKLAGEAEATRSTIDLLERRGRTTQAMAFRREVATAVRNGDDRAVRAIRSRVVACFSKKPVSNPADGGKFLAPPAGFANYFVESIAEGVDSVNFEKCKVYNVIAPDGTSGTLHRHGGKYKYHEQLDMFGYKKAVPAAPAPAVAVKAESKQIGLTFNPATRRVENPLGFIASALAHHATGKVADHVRKHAVRNPAVPPTAATNWMHNKVYHDGARDYVRTYPKTSGPRQRVEVDVTAFAPVASEIQTLNKWRLSLPRDPNAKPPKFVQAGTQKTRVGCRLSPLVARCGTNGVPYGEAQMANGSKIEYLWQVVDLNDIVASHHADTLTVNKLFPAELQPRDRGRQSYHEQINRLILGFDPSLLMWSANVSDGAPVVGPSDGVVESGNGRTIALTRIYASHPAKARQYQQTAQRWCKELGCEWPAWTAHSGARPVLVRVRQTELDRAEFARQANVAGQQVMSATELAISDSHNLNRDVLHLLTPDSDLGSAKNAKFVAAFIKHVAGESARGDMTGERGSLSKSGATRIQYALFARAWGEHAHNLVASLAEIRESDLRRILGAMLEVSPLWASFTDKIAAGDYDKKYNETRNIVAVVQKIRAAQDAGGHVLDDQHQINAFDVKSDEQHLWLCSIYPRVDEPPKKKDKVARKQSPNGGTFQSAIEAYVQLVIDQGRVGDGDIFGEPQKPAIRFIRLAVAEQVYDVDLPKLDHGDFIEKIAKKIDDVEAILLLPETWAEVLVAHITHSPQRRVTMAELRAVAEQVVKGERKVAEGIRRNPATRNPARCRCAGGVMCRSCETAHKHKFPQRGR